MTFRYFELGKNADPEREDSAQFRNAFTVHPVSEPNLMYRLHKRFSHIELEWTYQHIQQLQVRKFLTDRMWINYSSMKKALAPLKGVSLMFLCFPDADQQPK